MATIPDLSGAASDIGRLRTALASRYLQAYKQLASRDTSFDASAVTAHVTGGTEYATGHADALEKSAAQSPRKRLRREGAQKRYGKLGVGYLEARDDQGVWWPVTVVAENQDGSFTVRVRASKRCDRREMVVRETSLRAGKRRTAVMLPKGVAAFTDRRGGNGDVTVVVPDASGLDDKPAEKLYQEPETAVATGKAYYTLERCYEELAGTRSEKALLAKEVTALRGKLRASERRGVYLLEELLGKAVPQTKLTVSTTEGVFPTKQRMKHWEDVHNVMIRPVPPPAVNQMVLRGAKRDCYNVLAALDGAGVVSEVCDDEVAVNSAVRFIAGKTPDGVQENATGYVSALHADNGTAEVRFDETIIEHAALADLHLIQSPILWCSAAKVSVPLVTHGHFNILKNELIREKEKVGVLEGKLKLAKQKGGGSAMQHEADVRKLAEFVDLTQAEKNSIHALRDRCAQLEDALRKSEADRSRMQSQLEGIGEMTRDEVAKLKHKLREEKTGKLLAENHMALEGQWRCESGGGRAAGVFEILRNYSHELVFREHVHKEGADGVDITGVLRPVRNPQHVPAAVASVVEYEVELNDGGMLWVGRSDRCKLVRAYRGSVEEKVEAVSTASKVIADSDRVPLPPHVNGVCPRCAHNEGEIENAMSQKRMTEKQAELEHERNRKKIAEANAELMDVLSTKETELQQALKVIEDLRGERGNDGADVKALEEELRKCKAQLKKAVVESSQTSEVARLKAEIAVFKSEREASSQSIAKAVDDHLRKRGFDDRNNSAPAASAQSSSPNDDSSKSTGASAKRPKPSAKPKSAVALVAKAFALEGSATRGRAISLVARAHP